MNSDRHLTRVIDACSLLNLLATGRAAEVLTVARCTLIMPRQAREESLFLADGFDEKGKALYSLVTTDALEREGLISYVDTSKLPPALLIQCSERLTDVDAHVLALTLHRQLPLISDDTRVRRTAAEFAPTLETCGICGLLRVVAVGAQWTASEVADVLESMRSRARFAVPRGDDDGAWLAAAAGSGRR